MSQSAFDFAEDFIVRRIVDRESPVQWAYGAGVDSTAGIIADGLEGKRIDAITWANVGSERRATYDFIPTFNRWLYQHHYPQVTEVRYHPQCYRVGARCNWS